MPSDCARAVPRLRVATLRANLHLAAHWAACRKNPTRTSFVRTGMVGSATGMETSLWKIYNSKITNSKISERGRLPRRDEDPEGGRLPSCKKQAACVPPEAS